MDRRIEVEPGLELVAHLSQPARLHPSAQPGLVLAHGFPTDAGGINSADSLIELARRITADAGWASLAFGARGVAGSPGDFSLGGWLRDVRAAVDHLLDAVRLDGVWLVGFGTGGALSVEVAAADERIQGVAAVGAPADFQDWAKNPRKLLLHAREVGVVTDEAYPRSFDRWAADLGDVRAAEAAERLAPRGLLVLHGSDDESVPVFDARAVADGHGAADLRIIDGGGHHLRHDPRAIAVLLGWLDRQRAGLMGRPVEPA